ncbi:uncharacterized protein PAC_11595 [Phialocephala subalpina]|uniref:Uncharacterized protein n=1 Tax=Phialocephala subalpina TaxID=576137 RepID=A0A1L7X9I3_9HELO|nr:uncharacterized protein PAC_11595 [Phialocephala subalpina]
MRNGVGRRGIVTKAENEWVDVDDDDTESSSLEGKLKISWVLERALGPIGARGGVWFGVGGAGSRATGDTLYRRFRAVESARGLGSGDKTEGRRQVDLAVGAGESREGDGMSGEWWKYVGEEFNDVEEFK